jgi:hypothetical protein
METAIFANRKFILWFIRLAALLYILRRKRHQSIQRKKLYLWMSSVLENTSILAIYGLWKIKRNCIVDKSRAVRTIVEKSLALRLSLYL